MKTIESSRAVELAGAALLLIALLLIPLLITVLVAPSVAWAEEDASRSGDLASLDDLLDEPDLDESATQSAPATAPAAPTRVVEEIVVTANRRSQSIQEIVGGIRVLDGEELERTGASGFEDYVFKIPGTDFSDDGMAKKVAIRGIANLQTTPSGGTASPIGIYLNDTPIQGSGVLPDLDLYDLERIEVLKGPQGTLYGEGAQGGAIRMLLNRADPSELFAKGEVGVGQTQNGSGLNHFQKVALNVPVYDSWAARLVATRRVDQGYVDFPNRGTKGENDSTNLMGRLHVDGEIWDGLAVSAFGLHQRSRLDQFPMVQLSEGDLENKRTEPQFADSDLTLGELSLDYDFSFATLTSSTSLFVSDRDVLTRVPFIGYAALSAGFTVPDTVENEWAQARTHQKGFTQELRLVSSGDSWLDWVVGAFYRKRTNAFNSEITNSEAEEVPPPAGPGIIVANGVESFEQYALFADTTLRLPWDLELGLGLRGFREEVGLEGVFAFRGPFYPIAVAAGEPDSEFPRQKFSITTTAFTPRASLTWFADDARMLYAQFAQGVRSGGATADALYADVDPLFEPDFLWSYEIGAKTQWLDGLLTANLAAFYNDWRELQVLTAQDAMVGPVPLAVAARVNIGRAFTRGVELELSALPLDDLNLGFNLFVADGEIVEGDPGGSIPDHTAMPQLARLSYSSSASYTASSWPLFGFTPTLYLDTQFVGARTSAPPTLPGFVSAMDSFQTYGALLSFSSERFDASVGVKNLTNARPQLGANFFEPENITIGRPRTWTAKIGFRF